MSGHSSISEKSRQAKLEKQRERNRQEIEKAKDDLLAESSRDRTSANRFVGKTDSVEDSLKLQTMGLQRLEDFTAKKRALEEQRQREAAQTADLEKEERKKKKAAKKEKKSKLSFAADDDDEEQVQEDRPAKRAKLGKNPAVDTTFLPDREREDAERRTREELRQEWLKRQEELKGETIEVVFSYWDGSGHRKEVDCKKGDTIAQFLEKAKVLFPEIRGVSVDNLMYIKEDLIIPHHHTFYDFIVSKARGKSGPLFNFDVHDDVRLLADARIEKDESHAGKICERIWYSHNMHIFPASRWETYQPDKDYGQDGYRIKDKVAK